MPYEFVDDVAIADVAFRVWAPTFEELLRGAGEATTNVMVEKLDTIDRRGERIIDVEADAQDLLLVNFLQEIIFYKDAERLLLRPQEVAVTRRGKRWAATARLTGEPINPRKHELKVDVKAVTLHRLKVEQTERGWEAFVVLDI